MLCKAYAMDFLPGGREKCSPHDLGWVGKGNFPYPNYNLELSKKSGAFTWWVLTTVEKLTDGSGARECGVRGDRDEEEIADRGSENRVGKLPPPRLWSTGSVTPKGSMGALVLENTLPHFSNHGKRLADLVGKPLPTQ